VPDNIIVDMHHWEVARNLLFMVKPKSVLDVGVGEGMFWRGYGFRGHHNLRDPLIVEPWKLPWDCKIILCDYDVYNHPLPTVQCDAHNLPFQDKSFEMVISTEVLEHVVDPKKFANEIKRVGERYILTTPAIEERILSDEEESERLWQNNPWKINLVKSYSDKEFPHHRHLHIFNERELEELFPDAKIFFCFNRVENMRFFVIFK